jgi:hypothetical protein
MKIVEQLKETTRCPNCTNLSFNIVEIEGVIAIGNINIRKNNTIDNTIIGCPTIPLFFKCCDVCGFTGGFNSIILNKK